MAAVTRRQALLTGMATLAPGISLGAQTVAPAEVRSQVPQARLVGQGRLTWLGLNIYSARLWAPTGFNPERAAQSPFALELIYARALEGQRIAERSIEEMKRGGPLSDAQATQWRSEMSPLFPDVAAGDRLTGVNRVGEGARFFFNGQLKGEVSDDRFAQRFFGIWLSPETSEPELRKALLGAVLVGS